MIERDSEARVSIKCGTCEHYDDGICDKLGYVVEPDDSPADWTNFSLVSHGMCWELKSS